MAEIIMPTELTAENGAKAALISEFTQKVELVCCDCFCASSEPDEECKICQGTGYYQHEILVSWTNIKKIYKRAVELFGQTFRRYEMRIESPNQEGPLAESPRPMPVGEVGEQPKEKRMQPRQAITIVPSSNGFIVYAQGDIKLPSDPKDIATFTQLHGEYDRNALVCFIQNHFKDMEDEDAKF